MNSFEPTVLQRIKRLRFVTGWSLVECKRAVDANQDDKIISEWGDKPQAALSSLWSLMQQLMPGHPARQEYEQLISERARLARVLELCSGHP